MKTQSIKIYRFVTALTVLVIFSLSSSCSLLDVEPKNVLEEKESFKDVASFNRVLNGAYANLMGIYDGTDGGELLGADLKLFATLLYRQSGSEIFWDGSKAPSYTNILKKQILPTNAKVEANWLRAYKTINIANTIIEEVEKSSISEKNRIKGEALAMRGILYFELVRLWSPQYASSTSSSPAIPLILKSVRTKDDIKTPVKSTVSQIYSQVEKDLKEASSLLKASGKNGDKISYYVCEAYLARVYLQKNDFSNSEKHLSTVINSGIYSLANTPTKAFNNNSNSTEDILAVQQTSKANTGTVATVTGLPTLYASLTGSGLFAFRILETSMKFNIPNRPYFSSIDKRFTIDRKVDTKTSPESISTAFYLDPNAKTQLSCAKYVSSTQVIPVVRLAEMYLSRAEAIHEQNFSSPINAQALSDLNKVRARAGLTNLKDTLSATAFYDSIVLERNRELLFEGILLHDAKRWAAGRRKDKVKIAFRYSPLDNRFILPIPQSECDASPGLCK